MDEAQILRRLQGCRIANGYDGLADFREYSHSHPDESLRVVWSLLTEREDPGRDDGALCLELLTLVGSHRKASLESILRSQWEQLRPQIQENFIYGFASADVASLETVRAIFGNSATGVQQRHRIVALLASCRAAEAAREIVAMADNVGRYEDDERQMRLDRFLDKIRAEFRVPRNY